MQRLWFFLAGFLTLVPASSLAHKPSDSYLNINASGKRLTAEWEIGLRDLEILIGLDSDQDGEITWRELKDHRLAISAHALSRLEITADGSTCGLEVSDLRVTRHSDGSYAALNLISSCPGNADPLRVHYSLLFDRDPTHRGLVLFSDSGKTETYILKPSVPSVTLRTQASSIWAPFGAYLREGVWHILVGFDHLLFLLLVLLPTVLIRHRGRWHPADRFRPVMLGVLKIVTAFTLAHSSTLWLSVMGYVVLPGRLVETTIALSVLITALHNLYPVTPVSGAKIAFIFGLLHGFGFANVLFDLGLSSVALGVSLLGFNLGIEFVQIVIVAMFLPVAFSARHTLFYRSVVFRLGSVMTGLIAAFWMVQRLFDIRSLGL